MATDFDAVIIGGSGFGGAVSARLAEGGYRVPVLNEVAAGGAKSIQHHAQRLALKRGFNDRMVGSTSASTETSAPSPEPGSAVVYPTLPTSSSMPSKIFFRLVGHSEIATFGVLAFITRRLATFCSPPKFPLTSFPIASSCSKEPRSSPASARFYDEVELGIKFNPNYAYDAANEPRAEDSVMSVNADGLQQGFCVSRPM